MVLTRQFLVSPALARLIRKERGTQGRVREGYFSSTPDRTHFVRLDPPHCFLVMVTPDPEGQPHEETTEVPLSQAKALLDVAPGTIVYDRTSLALAPGVESILEQVLLSRELNLLTVTSVGPAEADRFQPPLWVGPEVTGDVLFKKALIALHAEPETPEVDITNASLEALLDLLQSRFASRETRVLSGLDPSTHPAQQPNRVDEQLLMGLAQALRSVNHIDGSAQSEHMPPDQAQQRIRRSIR